MSECETFIPQSARGHSVREYAGRYDWREADHTGPAQAELSDVPHSKEARFRHLNAWRSLGSCFTELQSLRRSFALTLERGLFRAKNMKKGIVQWKASLEQWKVFIVQWKATPGAMER